MQELSVNLKELCEADGFGGLKNAEEVAFSHLSKYMKVRRSNGSIIGEMRGKSDYTVLLDAHIDQIGMVVTSVSGGFVKVAAAGGIDARILPAARVVIYGKECVNGVFCSTPPHLDKADTVGKIEDMYIDTGLGETAEQVISVGDRVAFKCDFRELLNGRVTSKSLDDRAGCAALIYCAKLLSNKELPCNVVFLLSDKEEIGGMGAKTESFSVTPDCAVAVDVSFGDAPDIAPSKTGKLGGGPMIGVSPVLCSAVTDSLKKCAENSGIDYQLEVMGGKTSTNADKIVETKCGVPTGLVSIPLRNMHTESEIVDIADVEAAARLLAEFVLNVKEVK